MVGGISAKRTSFAKAVGRPPNWINSTGVSIPAVLRGLNSRLRAIGIETDRAIGHALLAIPASAHDASQALHQRFQLDIYPLVLEYCSLDRSQVKSVLGSLVSDSGDFLDYEADSFKAGLEALV
jgi:hypothetical protein